jgi:hypothetical protein
MTTLWEFDEKYPKQVNAYGTQSWVSAFTRAWKAQDWTSWVFTAVPTGLVLLGTYTQHSRAGLFSAVPAGLKSEAGSHA